jgi:hypothetical protein
MLPTTRVMAKQPMDSKSISIKPRKHRTINKSKHQLDEDVGDHREDRSTFGQNRIKWKRTPKEPIPQLSEISAWVGKQLRHENMPKKYQHMHPGVKLIPMDSTYPEGLLAVPNAEEQPRIIVPPTEVKALILQTHEDIHHQNHVKVTHVLKASYYWPNMAKDIERCAHHVPPVQQPSYGENTSKRNSTLNHRKHLLCHDNIMGSIFTDQTLEKYWL